MVQLLSLLFWATIIITPIAAWFTHVITCIQAETWGFLIGGAIFFPIAVVHGIGLWFGAF